MNRTQKSITAYVREAISKGITTYEGISGYLAKRGLRVSPSCVSLVKSGKKTKKFVVPYSVFNQEKHTDTFYKALKLLQDWVGNDETYLALLFSEIQTVKEKETP